MFVDEAEILVKAGDGGNGAVTFRREAGVPRGGPSGGDGGDGGDVILRARPGLDTLIDLRGHHHWYAPSGGPGRSKDMAGADGDDRVIDVPPGTLIYDKTLGLLIKDLSRPWEQVVAARGGKGGRGNARFATATNQTPRVAEPGRPGEQRRLRLELKLIADVGLVGLPNAGKSTLLSRLSAARPKIADYPFTTLHPSLGIVAAGEERRFIMADLPGLIEGAHHGVGLGDEFLRHVERTRILVHLVELSPHGHQTPADAYRTIRGELAAYSAPLAAKHEIVALTKADLAPGDEAPRRDLQKAIGRPVIAISSATGTGLVTLVKAILDRLDELAEEEAAKAKGAPAVAPAGRPGDPRPAQALVAAPAAPSAAPAAAPRRRTRKARAGGAKAGHRAPAKRKPRKAAPRKAKAKKPPRAKRTTKTRGSR
jgi:GTP-binding protein